MQEGINQVFAYTDGSTQYNPGVGGFASVIVNSDGNTVIHKHCEFIDITTNNQVELLATIYSVEWFIKNYDVKNSNNELYVISDSKYCTLGFNKRMHNWVKWGWKTTSGKTVKNVVLWEKLYNLTVDRRNIFFNWVKGHSGNKFNDIADVMSREVWKKKLNKK